MLLFSRGEAVRGLVRTRVEIVEGLSLAASPTLAYALAPQIPPATQASWEQVLFWVNLC